jgi:hypothetical protein
MGFKEKLYIYKGPNIVNSISMNKGRLSTLDVVIFHSYTSSIYVNVSPLKLGSAGVFSVLFTDLLPYEYFPEESHIDIRSIEFFNKIRRNRLVF